MSSYHKKLLMTNELTETHRWMDTLSNTLTNMDDFIGSVKSSGILDTKFPHFDLYPLRIATASFCCSFQVSRTISFQLHMT